MILLLGNLPGRTSLVCKPRLYFCRARYHKSPIRNQNGSNQRELIIIWGSSNLNQKNIIDVLRVHIYNNKHNKSWWESNSNMDSWGAPYNRQKNLNWLSLCGCVCVSVCVSKESSFLSWNTCHCSSGILGSFLNRSSLSP